MLLSLKAKSLLHSIKEEVLTAYCQLLNHLLETNVPRNIITNMNTDIACFVKLLNILQHHCANRHSLKTTRCPYEFDKLLLKRFFVERLPASIRDSMQPHSRRHKRALQQKWAYQATSLTNLQVAVHPGEQHHTDTDNRHNTNSHQYSH